MRTSVSTQILCNRTWMILSVILHSILELFSRIQLFSLFCLSLSKISVILYTRMIIRSQSRRRYVDIPKHSSPSSVSLLETWRKWLHVPNGNVIWVFNFYLLMFYLFNIKYSFPEIRIQLLVVNIFLLQNGRIIHIYINK